MSLYSSLKPHKISSSRLTALQWTYLVYSTEGAPEHTLASSSPSAGHPASTHPSHLGLEMAT